MRKAVAFGSCLVAIVLPAAAYVPAPNRHYSNVDYEFSVDIPDGLRGCLSEHTNHGVDILLDRRSTCDSDYDRRPYVDVSANYNAAVESDTAKGLARIYCRDRAARQVVWLKGWTLGGRKAAGCRQSFDGDRILVDLMTLRKTDPQNPEVWIEVGAALTTTTVRYKRDMRLFRRIVQTVRIAPDGPLK